ncbi:MAG: PilZ domain-containing protein [Myxococcota bacterium]|nr:PilZ domain-containing protein [Myxococcota bacterium]
MVSPAWSNGRDSLRYPLVIPVVVKGGDFEPFEAETLTISQGGCFVVSRCVGKIGDEYSVEMLLPFGWGPLTLSGRVAHVILASDGEKEVLPSAENSVDSRVSEGGLGRIPGFGLAWKQGVECELFGHFVERVVLLWRDYEQQLGRALFTIVGLDCRRYVRDHRTLQVRLHSVDRILGKGVAVPTDIASGGLFLITTDSYRIGEQLRLEIEEHDGAELLTLQVVVCWRGVKHHKRGVGVEFIFSDEEAAYRLNRIATGDEP